MMKKIHYLRALDGRGKAWTNKQKNHVSQLLTLFTPSIVSFMHCKSGKLSSNIYLSTSEKRKSNIDTISRTINVDRTLMNKC